MSDERKMVTLRVPAHLHTWVTMIARTRNETVTDTLIGLIEAAVAKAKRDPQFAVALAGVAKQEERRASELRQLLEELGPAHPHRGSGSGQ